MKKLCIGSQPYEFYFGARIIDLLIGLLQFKNVGLDNDDFGSSVKRIQGYVNREYFSRLVTFKIQKLSK